MKLDLLQQTFLKGKATENLDGFYKGKLVGLMPSNITESIGGLIAKFWLPWYGKTFYLNLNINFPIVYRIEF